MTCLEKYLLEHPGENPEDVVRHNCPNYEGGIDIADPSYCTGDDSHLCRTCWMREIPGTEMECAPLNPETDQRMRDFLIKGLGYIPVDEEPHIRDSGSRTEFSTGAVRDIQKGRGRCDLMPLDVVAKILCCGGGESDSIIDDLHLFQQTGDVDHLYCALGTFERTIGDTPTMLLEVSKHFEEGAEKYGENNWQKGLPVKCYINSAVRHYLKWLRGDKDEPHDRAFCWNIMCALWTCKHKSELNEYGMKTCLVCGESIPRDAKFCGNCMVSQRDPDEEEKA